VKLIPFITILLISLGVRAQQADVTKMLDSARKSHHSDGIADAADIHNPLPAVNTPEMDSVIRSVNEDYYKFAYAYRKKAYEWQLLSSRIILAVVIVVVLLGLYLSYLQFEAGARTLTRTTTSIKATDPPANSLPANSSPPNSSDAAFQQSTMELSKDGIKINSNVIGLIILVISIAFFFLYLRFVFGINGV
jgi:hypothetical protein